MKNREILILTLAVLLFGGLAQATLENIDIYSDRTIQDGDEYDYVTVRDSAIVDVRGGQVNHFEARNSSRINFYGGTVVYGFGTRDSGEIHVHSGTFNVGFGATGGKIIINGGVMNFSSSMGTNLFVMDINGGTVTFTDIVFYRNAVLNIYGGDITFNGNSSGKAFTLYNWSEFNVYYSDIIYEETDIIGYYLRDGGEFMLDQFTQDEISQINFVPEPASLSIFALGALLLRSGKKPL